MRLTKYVLTIMVVLAALAAGPAADAIMLVSKSEEVEIGKQVETESIKQYGGLSTDQTLVKRVERVGKSVAAVSTRKDVTYTYKVLNSDVINAFAAPGGPVMITKKLARMLTSDDELAFVLAHETGHVAAQHGRIAINRALIAQGAVSLLFGKASSITQTGVNVTLNLINLGYTRKQEYEADSKGLEFMSKAGYNSEGAIKALAKLGMTRTSGVNKYLSTHPDIPDRVDRIAQMAGISKDREQELIREVQPNDAKPAK